MIAGVFFETSDIRGRLNDRPGRATACGACPALGPGSFSHNSRIVKHRKSAAGITDFREQPHYSPELCDKPRRREDCACFFGASPRRPLTYDGIPSRQDLAQRHRDLRRLRQCDRVVRTVRIQGRETIAGRRPMDIHNPTAEVDDPHLGDAGASIERQLHGAVVAEGTVGDLDHQQRIGGTGPFAGRIKVGARAEHGEVGLRLIELVQADRVLHR